MFILIPVHPLEGGADLARDPLGAGLADAAVGRHVGGEVAHGRVLGGEHVVPVRLKGGKRGMNVEIVSP